MRVYLGKPNLNEDHTEITSAVPTPGLPSLSGSRDAEGHSQLHKSGGRVAHREDGRAAPC